MTQKEAMEFLELPESATESQIRKRLAEKLDYYTELSENAPSDFIRRFNRQNLTKLKTIESEIPTWNLPLMDSEIQFDMEDVNDESEGIAEIQNTMPVIISGKFKTLNKIPSNEPVAWLIIHTEGKSPKTFPVFFGKNYIGRKLQAGMTPFIAIEDDSFISRVHAVVEATNNPRIELFLSDSSASNGDKPSKNGTYLNGNERRISEKVKLNDADTIQVGHTKLMLRMNAQNNLNTIVEEVRKSKFMDTVILRNG